MCFSPLFSVEVSPFAAFRVTAALMHAVCLQVHCFGESKDYMLPGSRPGSFWFHDHGMHHTFELLFEWFCTFVIVLARS